VRSEDDESAFGEPGREVVIAVVFALDHVFWQAVSAVLTDHGGPLLVVPDLLGNSRMPQAKTSGYRSSTTS
jgi:hypothetical protein